MTEVTLDFRNDDWKWPISTSKVSAEIASLINVGDIVELGDKEFKVQCKKVLFKENKIVYNVKRFIIIK